MIQFLWAKPIYSIKVNRHII